MTTITIEEADAIVARVAKMNRWKRAYVRVVERNDAGLYMVEGLGSVAIRLGYKNHSPSWVKPFVRIYIVSTDTGHKWLVGDGRSWRWAKKMNTSSFMPILWAKTRDKGQV
jgi:hypothetical protein